MGGMNGVEHGRWAVLILHQIVGFGKFWLWQ